MTGQCLRDCWYVAATTPELGRELIGRTLLDQPVVMFRREDGTPVALEDRCAHRQVPLHVGQVADDGIKCGYHGWTYDKSGKCTSVPYLDMCTLKPNCVKSYPKVINGSEKDNNNRGKG